MTGRNIKVPGHTMKKSDPTNRYKWECYCGAWQIIFRKGSKFAPDETTSAKGEGNA